MRINNLRRYSKEVRDQLKKDRQNRRSRELNAPASGETKRQRGKGKGTT